MIIAIPSDDAKTISPYFGAAIGFLKVILEGDSWRILEYREIRFSANGVSDKSLQEIETNGKVLKEILECDAVICNIISRREYLDLHKTGIEVYATDEIKVDAALKAYLKSKHLQPEEDLLCEALRIRKITERVMID